MSWPWSWCWWDCGDRITYSQGKWQEFFTAVVLFGVFLIVQRLRTGHW